MFGGKALGRMAAGQPYPLYPVMADSKSAQVPYTVRCNAGMQHLRHYPLCYHMPARYVRRATRQHAPRASAYVSWQPSAARQGITGTATLTGSRRLKSAKPMASRRAPDAPDEPACTAMHDL